MSALSVLLKGVLVVDPAAAAVEHDGAWSTWGEISTSVSKIAACLSELDLGRDARIGIITRNRPDQLAAILAAIAADACIVAINPLVPDERLFAELGALKLPVLIGEAADLQRSGLREAVGSAGAAIITLEPRLAGVAFLPGHEKITEVDVTRVAPGIIIEMPTSGTTGPPKRISLQREAYERSFMSALSYEKDRRPDDPPKLRSGTQLITNPMTHIAGLWHVLSAILAGRKVCLLERFSVEGWRDAVVRHRPKIAGAVPAGLRMLLDANLPREDLSSLVAVRTGTAPVDPAIVDEFLQRYDIPVLQNYGATEFSGAVAGWTLPDFRAHYPAKRGSVGRFQPGVVARVVDPETGAERPIGEEGVLEMKAAQFGNKGEWLRTTDRAIIDADAFLFIKGRADNAIIRGGFKVHPDDVVSAIEGHPSIREAVVVGIADRRLGAVPVAAIILKSGAEAPSEAELAAFVKERLLAYQVPVCFRVVEDLPRTPSMKPSLPQVRALFADIESAA